MREIGIYVHVPFCVQKCAYCDFVSYADKIELSQQYIKEVKKEISAKRNEINEEIQVKTIYIGGGTPSYIKSALMVDLINHIRKEFVVKPDAEITIEANPGSITQPKLKDYMSVGINRLSMGLQTTDNKLLNRLGRVHTYNRFLESYLLARQMRNEKCKYRFNDRYTWSNNRNITGYN